MKETQKQIQEAFDELETLSPLDRVKFLDDFLFCLTIAGRGIWSDEQTTDAEKVNAFKWLNELLHRIWHVRFNLQNNEEQDFVTRLNENIKFHCDQSTLLRMHLIPTTVAAFNSFKEKQKLNDQQN